jgi:hypothetical protein
VRAPSRLLEGRIFNNMTVLFLWQVSLEGGAAQLTQFYLRILLAVNFCDGFLMDIERLATKADE